MTSGSSLPSDATQGLLGPFLTMSDSDTVPKALPDTVLAYWMDELHYGGVSDPDKGLDWAKIAAQEIRYLRKRVQELETTQPTAQSSTQPPNTDRLVYLLDLLEFGEVVSEADYNTRRTLEYLAQKLRGMIR